VRGVLADAPHLARELSVGGRRVLSPTGPVTSLIPDPIDCAFVAARAFGPGRVLAAALDRLDPSQRTELLARADAAVSSSTSPDARARAVCARAVIVLALRRPSAM
jgi:hypothetical protein